MALLKMLGLDVMPRISPRSIMALSSPFSSCLRWMLSSQRDCPKEVSFSIGFISPLLYKSISILRVFLSWPHAWQVVLRRAHLQYNELPGTLEPVPPRAPAQQRVRPG